MEGSDDNPVNLPEIDANQTVSETIPAIPQAVAETSGNVQVAPKRRYRVAIIIALVIFLAVLAGAVILLIKSSLFHKTAVNNSTPTQASPPVDMAEANNYFGLNLLKQIKYGKGNVFISPLSISSALTMVANGAEGDTLGEMQRVLGLDKLGLSAANKHYQQRIKDLNVSSGNLTLSLANSLWTTKDGTFLPDYQTLAQNIYDAKVAKAESADDINSWVESKTNGKIKNILDSLGSDLYLVNAVYFLGKWSAPFEASETQKENFQAAGGNVKADLMHNISKRQYYEDDRAQVVKLPYRPSATGDSYSMVVFLPNKSLSIDGFLKELDHSYYSNCVDSLAKAEVDLKLPKFVINWKQDLTKNVEDLGISKALDRGLTKIGNGSEPFVISKIIHQSFIKNNEEGTEAAAATAISMDALSIEQESERYEMYIDRPYFFTIQDDATKEMLFAGIIQDPTK